MKKKINNTFFLQNKKIAILSNTASHIWNLRQRIIKNLKKNNNIVYTISPKTSLFEDLKKNTNYIDIKLSRSGINPFYELKTIWQLYKIFKKEDFDLIHTFTIKLNIYGAIASRFANKKTKIVSQITGLGYVFDETKNKLLSKILKFIVIKLYKFSFYFSSKIIFQNQDDINFFIKKNITKKEKTFLIKSSGVNLKEYSRKNTNIKKINYFKKKLNISEKTIVISLIARILWYKGIKNFIEAAKIIKKKYNNTIFLLIGEIDKNNPDFVPEKYIINNEKDNIIKFIDFSKNRKNYNELLYISNIITLPSYYGEGVPRSLLEAMAMELPIITTNASGCRETVDENRNGFLVPVRDSVSLSRAIEKFIINPKLLIKFGEYSRIKAEKEFDEKIVAKKTINIYYNILND